MRSALGPLGLTALLLVRARPSWLLRGMVWGMAVDSGASCLRCRCWPNGGGCVGCSGVWGAWVLGVGMGWRRGKGRGRGRAC